MKSPRPGRSGMVLLEVVIALTIFTVVSFSLVMALQAGMTAAGRRNQVDRVMLSLENQLTLLRATRLVPQDKDVSDDGSGIAYHLHIELEQMQDQKKQPVPNIYRVTIAARWKTEGQPDDRSISELVYQP